MVVVPTQVTLRPAFVLLTDLRSPAGYGNTRLPSCVSKVFHIDGSESTVCRHEGNFTKIATLISIILQSHVKNAVLLLALRRLPPQGIDSLVACSILLDSLLRSVIYLGGVWWVVEGWPGRILHRRHAENRIVRPLEVCVQYFYRKGLPCYSYHRSTIYCPPESCVQDQQDIQKPTAFVEFPEQENLQFLTRLFTIEPGGKTLVLLMIMASLSST